MIKSYLPETIEELLEIIKNEDVHIFAGGTDLMIRKRQWQGAERRFEKPVVFINHLQELKGIKMYDNRYEIGALTSHSDIESSNLPEYIRTVYRQMGNPAIRNIATVGGNIVNDAKVADSLPLLYALNAKVQLINWQRERTIPIEDFIVGKYRTSIQSNEVLSKVIIPKEDFNDFSYKKVGQRKASILSKVSVIVLSAKDDIRISIGAVNPIVLRNKEIEKYYLQTKDVMGTVERYQALMKGEDDSRSTGRYRDKVACNILSDFLRGD